MNPTASLAWIVAVASALVVVVCSFVPWLSYDAFALALDSQPIGVSWLSDRAGMTDPRLAAALGALSLLCLLVNRIGWSRQVLVAPMFLGIAIMAIGYSVVVSDRYPPFDAAGPLGFLVWIPPVQPEVAGSPTAALWLVTVSGAAIAIASAAVYGLTGAPSRVAGAADMTVTASEGLARQL